MEYIWKKDKYFEQFCSIENIDAVYPFNICKKCNQIPFIDIINNNNNNYLIKNKCKCKEKEITIQEFVENSTKKGQLNPICPLRTHETRLGVRFCIECQKWFCVECLKNHLLEFSHKTIPYQVGFCPEHKDSELICCCLLCQVFFCKNCNITEHQKHTIISIQDTSEHMNYFTKNYQKMKSCINEITKNLESLKKTLQNLENNLNIFKVIDNMIKTYNHSKWKLFPMINLIYNCNSFNIIPLQKNYDEIKNIIQAISKNFENLEQKSINLFFENIKTKNQQVQYIIPIDMDRLVYCLKNSDIYIHNFSLGANSLLLQNNKLISYLTIFNKTTLFFYTSEINIKSLKINSNQETNDIRTIPCEKGIINAIQTHENKIIVLTKDNLMIIYNSEYKEEKKINISDNEKEYPFFARSIFEFGKKHILISFDEYLIIYDSKNNYSGLKLGGISSWGTDSIIQVGIKQLFIGGLESSCVVETPNWTKFSNVAKMSIGFNCIKRIPGTFYVICGDYNGNVHLYYLFGKEWYLNHPKKIIIENNVIISNIYFIGNQQIVTYNKDGKKIYKIIHLTEF